MGKRINKKMATYKNETKAFRRAMRRAENNAIVRAVNLPGDESGYGVYLDFAGESNLLVVRRSGSLYTALKGGVSLGNLRRWNPGPGRVQHRLSSQIDHILRIVDDEVEAILAAEPARYELPVTVYRESLLGERLGVISDRPLAA